MDITECQSSSRHEGWAEGNEDEEHDIRDEDIKDIGDPSWHVRARADESQRAGCSVGEQSARIGTKKQDTGQAE